MTVSCPVCGVGTMREAQGLNNMECVECGAKGKIIWNSAELEDEYRLRQNRKAHTVSKQQSK